MSKRKRKRRKNNMIVFSKPKYRVTIEYNDKLTLKKDFYLFSSMMDHYLTEHGRFITHSSNITDLSTGEVLHEYTSADSCEVKK